MFRAFSKAKTHIDPYKPTTAIISTGPFGYSRNPAYIALTLLFVGCAVAVDGLWLIAMVIPAVLAIHFFVVLREEAYLSANSVPNISTIRPPSVAGFEFQDSQAKARSR